MAETGSVPNTKNMMYNDIDARGLLMNIFGHDIIHDYGPKSSDTRWRHVDEIIETFIFKNTSVQTGGGDGDESSDDTNPSSSSQVSIHNPSQGTTTDESSGYGYGDEDESTNSGDERPIRPPTISVNDEDFLPTNKRASTPFQRFTFDTSPDESGYTSPESSTRTPASTSPSTDVEGTSPESSIRTPVSSPQSSTRTPASSPSSLGFSPSPGLASSPSSGDDESKPKILFPPVSLDSKDNLIDLQTEQKLPEDDTEITFDAMMDYIKQEIQIKIFLYKMEYFFSTDNNKTGGDKMSSVFDIFSDTYKILLGWFIQGANDSDETNVEEEGQADDKSDNEINQISGDNDIYQLYNFIAGLAGKQLSEQPSEQPSTGIDNEEKNVELYDALFEDKFMEYDKHDVESFKNYVQTMNIPFTKEEFTVDAFINSDDHKFIVGQLSKGTTRSGHVYRSSESDEGQHKSDLLLVDNDVIESHLRRSSRIRNNRIKNIIEAAKAEAAAAKAAAKAAAAAAASRDRTASSSSSSATAASRGGPAAAAKTEISRTDENNSDAREKTKLSSKTTIFRQQLIKFIAKTALYLYNNVSPHSNTGIYSIEHTILSKVVKDTKYNKYDEDLKQKIEIYIPQINLPKLELNELCEQTSSKYIINNATFLMNKDNDENHAMRKDKMHPTDIGYVVNAKRCVFCPLTSIIDAQPCCTFDKDKSLKEGVMEYGDMNFMIKGNGPNDNISYNGMLTLREGGKSPYQKIVDLKVTIKSPKLTMKDLKFTNLRLYGKTDGNNLLSASFVLQQALQGLFGFLVSQNNGVKNTIKNDQNDDYLNNLYELAINQTNNVFNYERGKR